jgi:hypothetical protein
VLRIGYIFTLALIILIGFVETATAQVPPLGGVGNRIGQPPAKQQNAPDSFGHRTGFEDSLTIRFRYLDTSRLRNFDSSIYDFTKRIPAPWYHVHLGNLGTASRSLIFEPYMKSGWDHGFHAFDNYNFTVAETQFFNTTRPFTELNYMLGSQAEQFIRLMHTQNIKPNWNAALEYRLINAPGTFQNQTTNHNNYRFTSWYQGPKKRYQNFVLVVGNKLQSGENGGIRTDQPYLDDTISYQERFTIPVVLGPDQNSGGRNPFNVNIPVGSFFTNATYLFRQQYDLGQKDSLVVNDTTTVPLFYPRLRLEHTFSYSTYKYRFRDNQADSVLYDSLYNIHLNLPTDTFFLQDQWRVLSNDFSLYQFPDAKNAQQFARAGATLENITGILDSGRLKKKYHNFFVHAEYRNKTRNQKWDIEANGKYYINGLNAGDYEAYISLKRIIGRQTAMQVGFQNTNRSPSFTYDPQSTFYRAALDSFGKENITTIFGSLDIPKIKLNLSAQYFLLSNFLYYVGYQQPAQTPTVFNVLRVSLEKQFGIARNFNWRMWVVVQQRIGDGPLNMPFLTTRHQLAYDGNLSFKNLATSFGLEFRYFTSYKAPTWSPFTGQYTFQDTATVRMKAPDISAFLHFRIKSFTAYVRAENLNTYDFSRGGFLRNNVPTRHYPYPGLQIRVGIWWSFVN